VLVCRGEVHQNEEEDVQELQLRHQANTFLMDGNSQATRRVTSLVAKLAYHRRQRSHTSPVFGLCTAVLALVWIQTAD
jgi:hypothetical protein